MGTSFTLLSNDLYIFVLSFLYQILRVASQ